MIPLSIQATSDAILQLEWIKGDEGAITEVRLNTASDVDETYPIVVYNTDNEGNKLGNIKDFQFVREYSYTLPTR